MDDNSAERWSRGTGRRGRWQGRRRVRGSGLFLPLLVAAIQVVGSTIADIHQPDALALSGLAYLLLLAGPAALVARRAHPLSSLILVLAATTAYLCTDYPRGPFFLAALVGLFSTAQRLPREAVWATAGTGYAVYLVVTTTADSAAGVRLSSPTLSAYAVVAACTAVAVALAEATRIRAEQYREAGRARAAAEHARQEQTRRQASDERLRIARELHDVLGHHLSLINVRAGVALHLLESRPDEVRDALEAIKVASAEALREVRGVLATLSPGDEAPPRSPAHGLADLEELATQARSAQLPVTLVRTGVVRPVPAEVDRAAYRIVQEALTNVRRHAGPAATATVRVGYRPRQLAISVTDTGTGPGTNSSTQDSHGNGIPGMRERAVALGGSLTATAMPGGGFLVEAALPIPDDRMEELA